MKLKILTFNMRHGRGIDGKLSLKRVAKIIRESNADIIGLNEVDQNFSWRSKYVDQLKWLKEDLQMHGIFGEAIMRKGENKSAYGNGLLSRYPIVFSENHVVTYPSWLQENRSILVSEVQMGEKTITILVTHLSLRNRLQDKHINELLEIVKSISSHIFVITGDFNMSETALLYKILADNFIDTARECNLVQPTFPSLLPRKRLDYVWTSKKGFKVEDVTVLKKYPFASDHLPLLVELKII